ncbi:MAG: TIGR04282 family arsenosugar biosynthesis glycosyltransferase [Acidimicrobiales bacterium]
MSRAQEGELHVLVMAKAPVAGAVKTRLCPPCSPAEAAAVAEAALADTLGAVAACGASRKVVALDGDPGPWLPPGLSVIPQRGATFAARLAHAWGDTGGTGIQIGMDTPQVGPGELDQLLALLAGGSPRRAVLGPAVDGGWWTIGLPAAAGSSTDGGYADLFEGVAMSTPRTGDDQRRRLGQLGFEVVLGSTRRDIDTVADLTEVAAEIPGSRTAATWRGLGLDHSLPSPRPAEVGHA